MTDTRSKARRAARWMGLMGVAFAAAPTVAAAQPLDLFVERTAMSAVGERCGLFAPETAAALAAAAVQARGSALRAGANLKSIQATERDARARAATLDCRAPRVVQAAARAQDAFSGFAHITRISYPGDVAGWQADRNVTRASRWRLSQESRFPGGRMTFGLAGREAPGVLGAVGEFSNGEAPYSARLVLRDSARTLGPYLPAGGGALQKRLPPRSTLKAYLAEARSAAPAELMPRESKATGWAFRFPTAAALALTALDPREAVAVEFLFSGERVVTAYVEVGDFAAGQAFLKLASR